MENTPVLLMQSASALDAELVCGFLRQEGIPFFCKERGPGEVYCGSVLLGTDVYVPESQLTVAREIMKDVLSAAPLAIGREEE